MPTTRRSLVAVSALAWLASRLRAETPSPATSPEVPAARVPDIFPTTDLALQREMVGVSHGNVARVRELLAAHPALAKASWDWGYGDAETALGAASHVGHREIAELLLAGGAPPTLFSATMLGQLDAVKALIGAAPGIQRTKGPHGISLLAHARAGGDRAAAVVAYLEALGGADSRYIDLPLAEADQRAIVGRYAFGGASSDVLIVEAGPRGIALQRQGGVSRGLLHQGERVFHPVGAEAVRVRFAAGESAPRLTVEDGPRRFVATRSAG